MSEERNEREVLIEETDAAKRRRENPAPKNKRPLNKWLIAIAVGVVLAIIAGLVVYHVRSSRDDELTAETTAAVATTAPTQAGVAIEDAFDHVATGEDALGGEMGGSGEDTSDESATDESTSEDAEDEDDGDDEEESEDTTKETTKKTTRKTTKKTTAWDPGRDVSKAVDDFWKDVSRQVG